MSTKSCINVVILALMFVFLVQSSIQQTPDNDNEQLCLSHDETWWQVTPRTGANLQVDIHMKLQAFSATNVNRGQVHLKVVEKKGPALGYTTPTVGVDLHGSYFIADNFTMSSLTCTVVLNNNYADDTAAICTKFKSMFASQTLKISFGDECEDLTLTGFTSFYKKALTFLPAVDPSTTCDLRGPHATGSYYWLSTNNRNYFGSQTKEDIFFVVEKDSKKFTLTQVVYLKESGVVDCNVNKLIATFKGDVTYNSQVSVLIANYTNCEIVQGLNNAECDLCSNGRNFFLNGPIHWTSNGTCDHWIYSSGAPDSGVDVLEASFAPTSLTPPTSETEITMFIIFAAIIFCILVFFIPFVLIVIRDCRRYREEKLRGGHQQL